MIKLLKLEKPEILTANAGSWTKTLVDKINSGDKPTDSEKTKYRHPDIKNTLIKETNGKCAYCESKLLHIHHGDVEHIYPKSLDPTKTYDWDNLTLACEVCNQLKSNHDPNMQYIIDPYNIEPAVHLNFVGTIMHAVTADYGQNTKSILKLNRAQLCERRMEKLEKTLSIFENILNETLPLPTRKAIYEDLLENEGANTSEYAAMNRAAILQLQSQLGEDFS
ncbi:HNH endonuclease [Methylotenera mobilis]|uniref:HNH endonuclease n=1 Tax=Methylotenera mobilis TaxID=359408 RepID=UPI00036F495F|nr:HNH endonuclease [Methylotenera mobilis]